MKRLQCLKTTLLLKSFIILLLAACSGNSGEQGDTGPQGSKGERGLTGLKGDPGETGPIGPAGKDGTDGKVPFLEMRVDSSQYEVTGTIYVMFYIDSTEQWTKPVGIQTRSEIIDSTNIGIIWNPSAGAAGYKVYWGKESGVYTFVKDVEKQTYYNFNISDKREGGYFAVTAYNNNGVESDYSEECKVRKRTD